MVILSQMMLNILAFCKEEEGEGAAVSMLTDDDAADGKTGSSILLNIVMPIYQVLIKEKIWYNNKKILWK